MSMNNRKIAGFMTAEGIYSLAFYIVMVAAIAGIGAGVMVKKDSAKAASAISLLRANFMAEGAILGYATVPAAANAVGAATMKRLSGGLLNITGAGGVDASIPGGGVVTMLLKTAGYATGGFGINITGITKPDVCAAVAGVGLGTWEAVTAAAMTSTLAANDAQGTPATLKDACAAAGTTAVTLGFASF